MENSASTLAPSSANLALEEAERALEWTPPSRLRDSLDPQTVFFFFFRGGGAENGVEITGFKIQDLRFTMQENFFCIAPKLEI